MKILDADDSFFTQHMHRYLQHLNHLAKTSIDIAITSYEVNNEKYEIAMKRHYNLRKKIVYTSFDELNPAKLLTMHGLT